MMEDGRAKVRPEGCRAVMMKSQSMFTAQEYTLGTLSISSCMSCTIGQPVRPAAIAAVAIHPTWMSLRKLQ